MFYELPPAGNPIVTRRSFAHPPAIEQHWLPFSVRWYGSGTSALAAAVMAAMANRNVDQPEVLVPAYGCPDVLSAVLYAGAKPVLVDLVRGRPWLDLDLLHQSIGPATIAVIAINFLGIPERVKQLRKIADTAGLTLIEDCAQSFPLVREDVRSLAGDLIILSFGRGKPVSMLGGGAVLGRSEKLMCKLPRAIGEHKRGAGNRRFRSKVAAYNFFRRPHVYWIIRALPFLGVGKTEFVPLEKLEPADDEIAENLAINVAHCQQIKRSAQNWIEDAMRVVPQERLIDLARSCCEDRRPWLLRYPLLIPDVEARERVYAALCREGLGGSRMYQRSMVDIPGVRNAVRVEGEFPNARHFAESLLTLPTHAQVRHRDVERMSTILRRELA